MKAGRILAWDRAKGVACKTPAYALTNDKGRSIVIVGNEQLPRGADLPDFVYTDVKPDSVAANRYVPEDEWPDEVVAWMAASALLGKVPD
jgi:hypothetical protein